MKLEDNVKYDDIIFGEKCGCYNCKKIFSPDQITTSTFDDGLEAEVAVCPYCDEATVVGDLDGELTPKNLDALHDKENSSDYYKKISH